MLHSVQKQFQDFISLKSLRGKRILVAVSGGVDSMVLSTLFKLENCLFDVAHCNFQLRGDESEADEDFVRRWCENNRVIFHTKRFEIQGSIQLNARNARYDWFNVLMKQYHYEYLATAHHLNDSLETTLLNLVRGTGLRGIRGINECSESLMRIRPIAKLTKSQIIDYAQKMEVSWREDVSNDKTNYDRNLIRWEVLPVLKKLNTALFETFKDTNERLKYADKIVQREVNKIKERVRHEETKSYLDIHWIKNEEDIYILSEFLNGFGFNYSTSKEIFRARYKVGKHFFSSNWELIIDRNQFVISRYTRREIEPILISDFGNYSIGNIKLKIELSQTSIERIMNNTNQLVAFFNPEKLEFPLKVRKWEKGDKFNPLGMRGMKKVSDYLIDMKANLFEKEGIMVLTSNEKIAWIMGHRLSDSFKVLNADSEVIKVVMSKSIPF